MTYKFVSPNNRGVPDRIFIKNGRVFFIEFKAPNKKETKLQDFNFEIIRAENIEVFVVDNILELEGILC